MLKNGRILLVEPHSEHARELVEVLAPDLSFVTHRQVDNKQELTQLLASESWDAVVCSDTLPATDNLHAFFANLPGMACQMSLDQGDEILFKYVSDGCYALLGISATELEQNSHILLDMLHPDDKDAFYKRMRTSVNRGIPWNWEGRIVLPPNQEIKWVNLRATHRVTPNKQVIWEGFLVNITQSKQAELEIKQSRQMLRELSSHIETIKEEERLRIAREIHDDIGVLLTALKMDLSWLTQRLPGSNTALHDKAKTMLDLLNTAGKAANDLVHSLRPGFLDYFGIVAAIEAEAKEFTKRTGVRCQVSKSDEHIEISKEQIITLYRVFQETLNNIMKHAEAQHVDIELCKTEQQICLTVTDDGKGFEESCRNKPRSFGLRGMQERIQHLGGSVNIESDLGQGTRVIVCIPL